jgi:hypothetical protein
LLWGGQAVAQQPAASWQPAGSSSQNKISLHKEAELPPLTVISAAAQAPAPGRDMRDKDYGPASGGFQPQLDPPGPDRIFRLESEQSLNERLKREVKQRVPKEPAAIFPEEPIVSLETYNGQLAKRVAMFEKRAMLIVEPNYVHHGSLLFEEKNSERFGWDLGIASPVVSAGYFFKDVLTLPYNLASHIGQGPDCSAGKCLPGDLVPYLIYPAEASLVGGVGQAGAILGLMAAFP